MDNLVQLIEYGQSYWLDNLTREKITGGELEKRVNEQGLRGITSNPAIFNKAISNSSDYDDQIQSLAEQGKSVEEIYEAVVVKDVQDACDVMRTVYDKTDGLDGYVSLEVSPHLAHDTEGTVEEARRLWAAVDRPNCFIKIPGTPAGVPAIEQMLYEGVNVNVTLLFSIEAYEAVAKAHIRALERRAAEGKSLDNIASVASFFLSRIDVLVDELLHHRMVPGDKSTTAQTAESFLGKVAIASARVAYQSFKRIYGTARWQLLAEKGATVQRPLWASTSTKNPSYSDTMYVDTLIGPHTVNTMPDETIQAFADHGQLKANTVERDLNESYEILDTLPDAHIDLDYVTTRLVDEGVEKFIKPYTKLLETISEEIKKLQPQA